MAYERRSNSGTAVETTLNGSINGSVELFAITSTSGWPTGSGGPFFAEIENEIIRCDSISGSTVTVSSGGRGFNGTVATSHNDGVAVKHVFTAADADESNYTTSETVGKITGAGQMLLSDAVSSFVAVDVKTSGRFLVGNGTTAVLVAMSGDATMASTGAVTIQNDTVTAAKIATDAVGTAEIAADAVTASEIAAGAVGSSELATGAVTAGKIGTGGISAAAQFASGVVDAAAIATDAVGSAEIAALAVTAAELAADSVTTAKILDDNVTTAKILNANVTQPKLASSADSTWTPTLVQPGAIAKTVVMAGYQVIFKRVLGNVTLAVTAAGTAENDVIVGLPVAAAVPTGTVVGTFHWGDSGTANYEGNLITYTATGGTTAKLITHNGTSFAGTSPFGIALANGDALSYTLNYPTT